MEQSKHSQGITSVKVHHQPGGKQSHNIFGNDPDADKDRFGGKGMRTGAAAVPVPQTEEEEEKKNEPTSVPAVDNADMPAAGKSQAKTSVKVAAPPGGRSQIQFG